MSMQTLPSRSVYPGERRLLVATGDALVLAAFLAYGLLSHAINPFQFPWHTLVTAIPFVIAWTVLAPLGGLYRQKTLDSIRVSLLRTVAVWVGVTLLAGGIRSTSLFPGESPPIFLLANFAFGLLFLLPWRGGVAFSGRWSVDR